MATFTINSIFNVIDILVGILLVIAAFVSFTGTFAGVIIPVYVILFGSLVIMMAFYVPAVLGAMLPFYMNFLGRGLTFLFLGCLIMNEYNDYRLAAAILTLMVAFAYIILWILQKFNVVPFGLPPPFLQSDQDPNASNDNDQEKKEDFEEYDADNNNDNQQPAQYGDDGDTNNNDIEQASNDETR